MISIRVGDQNIHSIDGGSVAWDEAGDNQIQITARGNIADRIFRQNYVSDVVAFDNGHEVWRGKLDSVQKTSAGEYIITAYGLLKQLNKIDDYTEFFSKSNPSWYELNANNSRYRVASGEFIYQNIAPANGIKYASSDNTILFGLQKGAVIPWPSGYGAATEIPRATQNTISAVYATVSHAMPANFLNTMLTVDTGVTTPFSNTSAATNYPLVYAGSFTDGTHALLFTGRNATGGNYTVTAENDIYNASLSNTRIMYGAADTISGTFSSALAPGENKALPISANSAIQIGDMLYTTISGEAITVSNIVGSTVYGDVLYGHRSGETYFIPKLYADPIIDDLVSRVGMRAIYLDAPNVDIPNATFIQQNAGSIINELRSKAHSSGDLKIVGVAGTVYVGNDNLPTYYADVDEYTLEKVVGDKIKYASGSYKTSFGVDRVTGSVSAPVDNGSYRSVAFKSDYTISGAVLNEMSTYLRSMSQVNVKSDFKVSKLYNRAGGIVEYPLPNARVIIRNLLPELYGIADYTYYLRAMTKDLVTGATEYVIGEYIDSVSTLLAGK